MLDTLSIFKDVDDLNIQNLHFNNHYHNKIKLTLIFYFDLALVV
jgi:hypothetical protein